MREKPEKLIAEYENLEVRLGEIIDRNPDKGLCGEDEKENTLKEAYGWLRDKVVEDKEECKKVMEQSDDWMATVEKELNEQISDSLYWINTINIGCDQLEIDINVAKSFDEGKISEKQYFNHMKQSQFLLKMNCSEYGEI